MMHTEEKNLKICLFYVAQFMMSLKHLKR